MVTTPAKGGAMGCAMAAVPRSIDRCTALCYGPASLAGDEWAGRAYCACANAQVQRSIECEYRGGDYFHAYTTPAHNSVAA